MYRKIMSDLKKWKVKKDRLPLILKGARQVEKHGYCRSLVKNVLKMFYI